MQFFAVSRGLRCSYSLYVLNIINFQIHILVKPRETAKNCTKSLVSEEKRQRWEGAMPGVLQREGLAARGGFVGADFSPPARAAIRPRRRGPLPKI